MWIEKVHQTPANFSVHHLFLGTPRNKTQWHFQRSKQSTWLPRACCAQLLWIMQQLRDLGINLKNVPIHCDNMSAINITKNSVPHSRTKHIKVRYHFIRDHVEKGDVSLEFVPTNSQLADIFTKPLCED